MEKKISISLLPGDGIGQEISVEAKKILSWLSDKTKIEIDLFEDLVGGAAIDAHGSPLSEETLNKIKKTDAIILGAVGGPKWESLDFEKRPERGLLKIRKELDLFANFRPALVFDSLIQSSTLKPDVIEGLDILIIRELTGGIYFGQPRGIKKIDDNNYKGINTLVYTTQEIRRIAEVAFETAMSRSKKLCSVDKANVLESTELWRNVMIDTSKKFPDVKLSHMYVDNASMQLVRNPKQFDVIVTTNMFGDILSDCASMLTGSLGMLPSASIGINKDSKKNAMYEPVHGSAPDIAGKGVANPLAMILSIGMMFKYSFSNENIYKIINKSVNSILNKGFRTKDILTDGTIEVSTSEMGNKVLEELNNEKI
ncbi:MAG: 3-isopropylmalate dehydrogenase [Pseudomonadota bacterium]|nr:3-isopropylmalate dehydrogenase [Pseudomonadota bacterium]